MNKFKYGQNVTVKDDAPVIKNEYPEWITSMDKYLGRIGKVHAVVDDKYGITYLCQFVDGEQYYFAEKWLEPVPVILMDVLEELSTMLHMYYHLSEKVDNLMKFTDPK